MRTGGWDAVPSPVAGRSRIAHQPGRHTSAPPRSSVDPARRPVWLKSCFPGEAGHPLSKGRQDRTLGRRASAHRGSEPPVQASEPDHFLPFPGTPNSSPHLLLARLTSTAQARRRHHHLQKAVGEPASLRGGLWAGKCPHPAQLPGPSV